MISHDPLFDEPCYNYQKFVRLLVYLYKDIHTQAHTRTLCLIYMHYPKSTVLSSFLGRKMHTNDFCIVEIGHAYHYHNLVLELVNLV